MTYSDIRQRVIIIHGLVKKLFEDCELLCEECKNEHDCDKKEILKTRICELGNRLHKYKNDLEKLNGKLQQV